MIVYLERISADLVCVSINLSISFKNIYIYYYSIIPVVKLGRTGNLQMEFLCLAF